MIEKTLPAFRWAGLASMASLFLAMHCATAAQPTTASTQAPVARVEPVTDTHFGEPVVDRYRWMENSADADWEPFLDGQARHARSHFDALPGREHMLHRIYDHSRDFAEPKEVQFAGRRTFFQMRAAGSPTTELYIIEDGRTQLLLDPARFDTAQQAHVLDWWSVSFDGRKLAFGLSVDGSGDSVLHVLDIKTGKVLPLRIANTENGHPNWLPDSSGFFYRQLTSPPGSADRHLRSQVRFHRLGADPARDPVIVAAGLDPRLSLDDADEPQLITSPGSRHAFLAMVDVSNDVRLLVAPLNDILAKRAQWRPVASLADEVSGVALHGERLVVLSHRGHPNGRVLETSASRPNLATARELVPESALVLKSVARARDGLYIGALDAGIGKLRRLDDKGRLTDIALPFDSTIDAIYTEVDVPGALMRLSGWFEPPGVWWTDGTGKARESGITPRPQVNVGAYTAERGVARAADGTAIPYTLLYRQDLKRDGRNPAFISAFGSYGEVTHGPAFAGRQLALVDAGAIVGFAHVRGGGEYGRAWHRAGLLDNRPNTWRDLIAVCEELHRQGYSTPSRTAIGSFSVGAIAVGMAMAERPELFAAVVAQGGWHNPLRMRAEPEPFDEADEWGTIDDPAGFRALKSIDSYGAVRDGVAYPAVLLTLQANGHYNAPFNQAKMAARLQAASSSGKPVLLRVDFDSGPKQASTVHNHNQEYADIYAFILAHTSGEPEPER